MEIKSVLLILKVAVLAAKAQESEPGHGFSEDGIGNIFLAANMSCDRYEYRRHVSSYRKCLKSARIWFDHEWYEAPMGVVTGSLKLALCDMIRKEVGQGLITFSKMTRKNILLFSDGIFTSQGSLKILQIIYQE